MGYGSYSASDWTKLKQSRNLSSDRNVNEIFTRKSCNPKFDPKYIGTRECFDSEDHPNSTPIVVGLDVTASMGYLAVKVASEALNDLITKLYSTNVVEDPALMCAAYGDYSDKSPLQVTQFESDIRIAEQLLDIYFENGGRGQVVPSCLWEFLLKHTNIDAINKRGQKGFVFTIGDGAPIREDHYHETVRRVIGDKLVFENVRSTLGRLEEKFHVFHIMLGRRDENPDILTGHKIRIDREYVDILPDVILGTIRLIKGEDINKITMDVDEILRPAVVNALGQLSIFPEQGPITL